MEWMNKLVDDIDALLLNDKSVRFNTHKNRKRIVGTISGMIKSAVADNTVIDGFAEAKLSKKELPPKLQQVVTQINPEKKTTGFAVATESSSAQVDEAHKNVPRNITGYDKNAVANNNVYNSRR